MECDIFPSEEPCNHFNRRHLEPKKSKKPKSPEPQMCQNCKCSSKFIDLTKIYASDESSITSEVLSVSVKIFNTSSSSFVVRLNSK